MNLKLIYTLLAVIAMTLAGAFLLCLGLAWAVFSEEAAVVGGWLTATTLTGVVAGVLWLLGRGATTTFFRKEGLAVIGLGWLMASVLGAVPYLTVLEGVHWADALFESASGLTTTGASVFGDIESFPRSLLFWRCLSQWIGGLGVVVFFVAILSFLGAGGKILYSNEASASAADLNTARVQEGVGRIAQLYLGLSLACLLAYKLAGLDWFDGICHMFATVSTGGFGTRSASMGAFQNPALEWVATVFMLIAGTSFPLLLRLAVGDWRAVRRNAELRAYYAVVIGAIATLTLVFAAMDPIRAFPDAVRTAAFHVASIITTTGFSSEDYTEWAPAGRVILLMLMIFGGCSGSTSGGVKIGRIVVALRVCLLDIERAFRNRVVRPLRLNGQILEAEDRAEVMSFLVLTALILLAGTLVLSLLEPTTSVIGVISATIATLFNIGPGLAEVGPAAVFDFFTPASKVLMSLLMIMGRVEFYAILVLFAPSLWRRFD